MIRRLGIAFAIVLLLLPSSFAQGEGGCLSSCLCGCQAPVDYGHSDGHGPQVGKSCCCKADKAPSSETTPPSPERQTGEISIPLATYCLGDNSVVPQPAINAGFLSARFPSRAPPGKLHIRFCVFLC